jgi:hypothetical protein
VSPIAGSGIDIWRGAGPPANSSKRSRDHSIRAVRPQIGHARSTVPGRRSGRTVRVGDHPGHLNERTDRRRRRS